MSWFNRNPKLNWSQTMTKVVGTVIWNCSHVWTRPKNTELMSSPGNNSAKTMRVGFLASSATELNRTAGQNPDYWPVTPTGSYHYHKWTPHSNPSPHSLQIIQRLVCYLPPCVEALSDLITSMLNPKMSFVINTNLLHSLVKRWSTRC